MTGYWRASSGKGVGVLLVAMALLSGGLYYANVREETERSECQAQYNRAFAGQLIARAKITEAADMARHEADRSKTTLLKGVGSLFLLPPTEDPKVLAKRNQDFLQLFRDFDKASAKAEAAEIAVEKARAENPLPPIPQC
jgi:hypothetical protein